MDTKAHCQHQRDRGICVCRNLHGDLWRPQRQAQCTGQPDYRLRSHARPLSGIYRPARHRIANSNILYRRTGRRTNRRDLPRRRNNGRKRHAHFEIVEPNPGTKHFNPGSPLVRTNQQHGKHPVEPGKSGHSQPPGTDAR